MSDKETGPGGKRRYLMGWINKKEKQIKYALINVFFTLLITLIVNFISIYKISQISNYCADSGGTLNTPPMVDFVNFMTWSSAIAITLSGVMCFCFIIFLTHRFFGPLVSVQRKLDDMIAGNFKGVLELRKGDELDELAQKLNKLSETLQNKYAKR